MICNFPFDIRRANSRNKQYCLSNLPKVTLKYSNPIFANAPSIYDQFNNSLCLVNYTSQRPQSRNYNKVSKTSVQHNASSSKQYRDISTEHTKNAVAGIDLLSIKVEGKKIVHTNLKKKFSFYKPALKFQHASKRATTPYIIRRSPSKSYSHTEKALPHLQQNHPDINEYADITIHVILNKNKAKA